MKARERVESRRWRIVMAIELPDARQLSDEALAVLRVRALRGIE